MLLAVFSFVPVALAFFLIVFGVPGRPLLAPRPRNLALVGAAALVFGPIAQIVLGFAGWLALLGLLVCCLLLGASLGGPPRRRALQE